VAKPTKAEREILEAAIKRLDRAVLADKDNREAAIDDLTFLHGDQWNAQERKRREDKGRPALQFNYLPKFVDQVCGDALHNTPAIKIRPVDSKADIKIAKIRQGIISNVEYLSNSKSIYGYGMRQQVSCGYGAWRVLTRYTSENPFLQEAYIESIRNPFLVYMDPDSKDQFYADAKYGFVMERMDKEKFEETYPKAQWPSDSFTLGPGLSDENWYDGDALTVAEYFTVESEKIVMIQLEDGSTVSEDEFKEMQSRWREKNQSLLAKVVPAVDPVLPQGVSPGPPPPQGMPPMDGQEQQPGLPPGASQMTNQGPPLPQGAPNPLAVGVDQLGPEPKVAKRRTTEKCVIRHRTITCLEILDGGVEGNRVAGKFIPVVLVKGKELNIEGKNYVYSLIRHAKDPQKMANYWYSGAAESIALQPKTPWLGTAKQFEGYEKDYAAANVENFPFLKYNADPDAPGPPQRTGPPQPPAAIFEMLRKSEDSIKSVIGMFNADIGAPGSEQTGAAITARQRPGDIATYEFSVNMAGAVAHTGRILNDMIPEIYDSERDVRLRNIDETETFMPVNTTVGAALRAVKARPEIYGLDPARLSQMVAKDGKSAKFNDITAGKYDVVVTTGPSYSTQRQEAAQMLQSLVQSAPQQMAVALDLIVRNMDFKDSDELEARLRKPLLSSGMVKPKPGEQIPQAQPDPKVIEAQAQMAKIQSQTQVAHVQMEQEKIKLEQAKVRLAMEIAWLQAETGKKDTSVVLSAVESERKHALEAERIRLERERLDHQRSQDDRDLGLRAMQQFHARQGKQKQGGA